MLYTAAFILIGVWFLGLSWAGFALLWRWPLDGSAKMPGRVSGGIKTEMLLEIKTDETSGG